MTSDYVTPMYNTDDNISSLNGRSKCEPPVALTQVTVDHRQLQTMPYPNVVNWRIHTMWTRL